MREDLLVAALMRANSGSLGSLHVEESSPSCSETSVPSSAYAGSGRRCRRFDTVPVDRPMYIHHAYASFLRDALSR